MPLQTDATPCLLVDHARLKANLERMREHLARLGVPLRPHLKTCKNIEIGRLALQGQPGGITVSTLAEAEYFAAHGLNDILYAVGIAPGKVDRCVHLMEQGVALTLVLDNPDTARALAEVTGKRKRPFQVLLEIDSDAQRAGFVPDDPTLVETARLLEQAGCEVSGVLTHAGGSYGCSSIPGIAAMAETERMAVVTAAGRLRESGFPCPVASVGSTPTAWFARDLSGVTEVRAGVYMFQDLVMAGLGVCRPEDIALSVLTEVIGHRRQQGEVLIDAGWTALSRDRGTAGQTVDQGYGLACTADGEILTDTIVRATNQEHGILAHRNGEPLDIKRFPIGQRLRILPNHACATAGQFNRYRVIGAGKELPETLERCSGW